MDVQQLAALVLVATAALFLGRLLWREARGEGDGECGGCGGACGKPTRSPKSNIVREAPQATPLITLGSGSPSARLPRRPTVKADAPEA